MYSQEHVQLTSSAVILQLYHKALGLLGFACFYGFLKRWQQTKNALTCLMHSVTFIPVLCNLRCLFQWKSGQNKTWKFWVELDWRLHRFCWIFHIVFASCIPSIFTSYVFKVDALKHISLFMFDSPSPSMFLFLQPFGIVDILYLSLIHLYIVNIYIGWC